MGAKNHQPCNQYLPNSTKLSRSVSLAYIFLETANVSLEDILLAELGGEKTIGVGGIVDGLSKSALAIREALSNCKDLHLQMDEKGYSEPDILCSVNLKSLGKILCQKGLIQLGAWSKISELILHQGFYSVLSYFEKSLVELSQKTEEVIEKVKALESIAGTSQINLVLEENTDANLKVEFFQLYTLWGRFNTEFVASSVLSTEIWYLDNDYGSLLGTKSALSKVV